MIPIKVMIFEYVLNDYCIFDRPNCMVGVLDEIDNAADNTFYILYDLYNTKSWVLNIVVIYIQMVIFRLARVCVRYVIFKNIAGAEVKLKGSWLI